MPNPPPHFIETAPGVFDAPSRGRGLPRAEAVPPRTEAGAPLSQEASIKTRPGAIVSDSVDEKAAKTAVKHEIKDLHMPFIAWLRIKELPYVHADPSRRSTIAKGWPDFGVFHDGRHVFVEFKVPGGKLRPDQEACHRRMAAAGESVLVTSDLAEAISYTCGILLNSAHVSQATPSSTA